MDGTKGHFVESLMATLFSIAFTGLFIAFIVAAVLGHVLLIEAYVRPFVVRLANLRQTPRLSNLQAAR
jgi:hypothetical protein